MSTNTCSLNILIWVTTEVGGIREKVGQTSLPLFYREADGFVTQSPETELRLDPSTSDSQCNSLCTKVDKGTKETGNTNPTRPVTASSYQVLILTSESLLHAAGALTHDNDERKVKLLFPTLEMRKQRHGGIQGKVQVQKLNKQWKWEILLSLYRNTDVSIPKSTFGLQQFWEY